MPNNLSHPSPSAIPNPPQKRGLKDNCRYTRLFGTKSVLCGILELPDKKNPVGHIFFSAAKLSSLCVNEYLYVHLSLHTSHFKVKFKHTSNIIKPQNFVCLVSPLELFHSKDNVGRSIILIITTII